MAEQFGNYKVFSSNSSTQQRASVTVRRDDGAICARIYSSRSQPLRFLRNWANCEERLDLMGQLKDNGVPDDIIKQIVSMRDK